MSNRYLVLPPTGVPIYDTFTDFPSSAIMGALGVAADTGNLYEFNGTTWVILATSGGGSGISVGDPVGNATANANLYINATGFLAAGFHLLDTNGITSIDLNAHLLNDLSNAKSADYAQRLLYASNGVTTSIDWGASLLYSGGIVTVDWASGLLKSSAVTRVDWINSTLFDSGGVNSALNWGTRILSDASVLASVSWGSRFLFYSNGTSVSVDYGTGVLSDIGSTSTLNWNLKQLYSISTLSLDWSTRQLITLGGSIPALDWSNGSLYSSGVLSLDWVGRRLVSVDGSTTVINWGSGVGQLGFFGVSPALRPTTSIPAASFAANSSGIIDDSATWGGYTIGQIVGALQSLGLLT